MSDNNNDFYSWERERLNNKNNGLSFWGIVLAIIVGGAILAILG